MTDKERLENINPIGFDLNGGILLTLEDYYWLVEQAERVEELESEIENWQKGRFLAVSTFVKEIDLKKRVHELEQQNKRYREALKNIYELAEYDEYDNTLEQIVSEVEKTLEGEE